MIRICLFTFLISLSAHSVSIAQPPWDPPWITDISQANMDQYHNSTFNWGIGGSQSFQYPFLYSLSPFDAVIPWEGAWVTFTYTPPQMHFGPEFDPKIKVELERSGGPGGWEAIPAFEEEIPVDLDESEYVFFWIPKIFITLHKHDVYRLKITTPDGAVHYYYFQ